MNHTLEMNGREILSEGKKTEREQLLKGNSRNQHSGMLPEIKISFEGNKLYANDAAQRLLLQLGLRNAAHTREYFFTRHGNILRYSVNTDFEIHVGKWIYCFTAMAFDEAGYIGLYCYRITKNKITGNSSTLIH